MYLAINEVSVIVLRKMLLVIFNGIKNGLTNCRQGFI